ncbi:MAG TPA: hypothetical protein VGI10_04420 [Polyangiaceae bacterium]|jgi:hypothetical protein
MKAAAKPKTKVATADTSRDAIVGLRVAGKIRASIAGDSVALIRIDETFRELTGLDPRAAANVVVFEAFEQFAAAVVAPTEERTAWLARIVRPEIDDHPKEAKRLRVMACIHGAARLGAAAIRERTSVAREALAQIDPGFRELSDAVIEKAATTTTRRTGTHKDAANAAAILSVAARVLGDGRQKGETEKRAIDRAAKAYRKAWKNCSDLVADMRVIEHT